MIVATPNSTERHPIACDCCGTETVAVLIGNRLVIKQRRHGRTHTAVVILPCVVDPSLDRRGGRAAH